VLEKPVEATGPIELVLYASSSARDTDFTGKLVDVYPDGRAEILTDGILRARYRESFSEPKLLEPGQIYELHLDLWATSNLFKAGHRIRLEVSSSNFPRFDRNTNTGGSSRRKPSTISCKPSTASTMMLLIPPICSCPSSSAIEHGLLLTTETVHFNSYGVGIIVGLIDGWIRETLTELKRSYYNAKIGRYDGCAGLAWPARHGAAL
jgi:hypothetical protein